MLLHLHRTYSKDEYVLLLKQEISEKDIKIGKLKSHVAELMYELDAVRKLKMENGLKSKQQWSETEIGQIYQKKLNVLSTQLAQMRRSKIEWQEKGIQLLLQLNKLKDESNSNK